MGVLCLFEAIAWEIAMAKGRNKRKRKEPRPKPFPWGRILEVTAEALLVAHVVLEVIHQSGVLNGIGMGC
jgi:hypothetical protein